MSADDAFLLVLLGTLGIYAEFVWPGRVFPGVAGALLAVAGLRGLSRLELTTSGVILIALAAALFVVEALWPVKLTAGIAASGALATGSCLLLQAPARLSPSLAVPASLFLGSVTTFLCWAAKRAHRNKWADLTDASPPDK